MMNKDEAVQKLATVGRLSIAHAEDLYDSFFPKPVIPYYIADYLEKVKSEGDLTVVGAVNEAPEGRVGDWLILEKVNIFAKAWVNGYKVEGEPKYTVEFKGIDDNYKFLNYGTSFKEWTFDDSEGAKGVRVAHTRKELETNGFGWVFDCPGVEVKEATDE
jgi:phenylacetate-coenzyme A ligase PaaK-like adenylate-forming protein